MRAAKRGAKREKREAAARDALAEAQANLQLSPRPAAGRSCASAERGSTPGQVSPPPYMMQIPPEHAPQSHIGDAKLLYLGKLNQEAIYPAMLLGMSVAVMACSMQVCSTLCQHILSGNS